MNEKGFFLKEFVRAPTRVGAIAPSSARLASLAVTPIPTDGDPAVVELGPGTGPFTEAIQRCLGGRGHHVAVEISPRLAESLAGRYPGVDVVNEDAATLPDILASRNIPKADVVISGLPWAAFSRELQSSILGAVGAALVPGGTFTTFAYVHALRLPPAVRFRRLLETSFGQVTTSRTVWRNLPPALVYFATGPR